MGLLTGCSQVVVYRLFAITFRALDLPLCAVYFYIRRFLSFWTQEYNICFEVMCQNDRSRHLMVVRRIYKVGFDDHFVLFGRIFSYSITLLVSKVYCRRHAHHARACLAR